MLGRALRRALEGPSLEDKYDAMERQVSVMKGEPVEAEADPVGRFLDGFGELINAAVATGERELAPALELEARAPQHPELGRPYSRAATVRALRGLRVQPPRARRPVCRPRARGHRARRTTSPTRGSPDDEGEPPPPGETAGRVVRTPAGSTA